MEERDNAQHSMEEGENAQRSTPNAQRSMKKAAISLRVLFCRPNAGEEDFNEFFGFLKDACHFPLGNHRGFLREP
jgi:hypothetical protein